jgi:hypothetical protein
MFACFGAEDTLQEFNGLYNSFSRPLGTTVTSRSAIAVCDSTSRVHYTSFAAITLGARTGTRTFLVLLAMTKLWTHCAVEQAISRLGRDLICHFDAISLRRRTRNRPPQRMVFNYPVRLDPNPKLRVRTRRHHLDPEATKDIRSIGSACSAMVIASRNNTERSCLDRHTAGFDHAGVELPEHPRRAGRFLVRPQISIGHHLPSMCPPSTQMKPVAVVKTGDCGP